MGLLPYSGKNSSLGIVVQSIEQQSQEHAEFRGLVEMSSGSSLPVVSEFVGVLNLETREIAIQQTQPEKNYGGRISENGRVIVLRQAGQAKPIHLVHEETLKRFV